ncbi:helix-turn-helix domain-containing protein [Paenibacillus nasutitermitis]|uniref:Two-component system, response regulator YesN n=1 Tax=Paenibacillus nasutitermitis TaxID=1652958 RepID=A0A916YQB7_9BACL|nr:helix-turn-helix domain-containing protein [Paenibacillus nasutitermitis]GGD56186.1 hypothetical protein GCM10010911_12400 [Paenibacillus nasutitermitis]
MNTAFIKVMLVDDEPLALEHLKHLVPWRELGFEIIAETTYPQQAVELHRKLRADIIFADIKMPGMDGLALSKALLKEAGGTKIVLLTSYKEFDYAKEALKLGISDYLVKHELSSSQLTVVLEQMKEELKQQERKGKLIRRQLFQELMKGSRPAEQQKQLWAENADAKSRFLLILAGVDLPVGPFSALHSYAAPNQLQIPDVGTADGILNYDTIQLEPCRWAIVATVAEKDGYAQLQPLALSIIRDLQQRFRKATGETLSAVVSLNVCGLDGMRQLLSLYERIFAYTPFFGRESVMHPDSVLFGEDRDMEHSKEWVNQVLHGLERLEDTGEALIANAFELEIGRVHLKAVYWLGDKLLSAILAFRTERNLPVPAEHGSGNYTFREMSEYLQGLYRETVTDCRKLLNGRYSRKVRETLQAIDDRYAEGLTIEELAAQVGISGDRLRRMFKQETGTSPLDYLTQVRIREAKKLLQSEKYRISEVAEKVGYRDSQYFSQVFRKAVGVNPLMYVKRGGPQHENED